MTKKRIGNLVYSTDPDFEKRCARCGQYPCVCQPTESLPPRQQTARIWRDRKRRAGKTVTVIGNLQLSPKELEALARRLKQACGAGGTLKDGEIEVQGDHRERAAELLAELGYKSKFVGG
ncbi:MAG TPA: translation initiation factor [Anaerolineae bacterium]|nr:translation initiation factor [Anaerolineae bacterium]